MKNAFYFIIKALFVLKVFKSLSWLFWSCRKNGLIKKLRLIWPVWLNGWVFVYELSGYGFESHCTQLISKLMMSQPGKRTRHILPNISRSKGNQAMKFGQVIGYNRINIFHAKNLANSETETSSRHFFLKKSFIWGKSKFCSLGSIYFDSPQPSIQ